MAKGYYGSICIEDTFKDKIQKGNNGKHYVCIEDLTGTPFNKGKTNGKTYCEISVWINDDPDQFGQIAGISLKQTPAEIEAKAKRTYIGNLKEIGKKAGPAAPAQQFSQPAQVPVGDLPF